jgi:hypothetical protein
MATESITTSVADVNTKQLGDEPSQFAAHRQTLANLALQGAINFQQGANAAMLNIINGWAVVNKAVVGRIAETVVTTDVAESAALTPLAQQAGKTAGITPPVTA